MQKTIRYGSFFTDIVQPNKNKHKERHKIEKDLKTIAVLTNIKPGFDVYSNLVIESPEPVALFDQTKILLFEKLDTTFKQVKYKIESDSINKRRFKLAYPWKFATNYKLSIDSAAIKTIYQLDSKGFNQEFKTQEEEHYGKIILNMKNITVPTIIQLLNDDKKETIVQSIPLAKDGEITFKFLEPKKYLIKAIFDRNNNKKWDGGNLKKGIPPEQVMYYLSVVKVRSNWDIKDDWTLPSQPLFNKKIVDEELEAQKLKDKLKKRKKTTAF